jgi:hypothetical protein
LGDVWSWTRTNNINTKAKILQFWTTRNLFLSNDPVVGYMHTGITVLKYNSDNPGFLRVLVAHETGHALGCPHDFHVSGFIMQNGANASCTRFSTLADQGGIANSSQQLIRNTILQDLNSYEDCSPNTCEEVKGIKMNSTASNDSITIRWNGNGKFLTKYKVDGSADYDLSNLKETSSDHLILKGLEPCNLYQFAVQRICPDGSLSKSSSIIINSSYFSTKAKPLNLHGDLFDLQLEVDCKHCSSDEYLINIDQKPFKIEANASTNKLILKDLFADGARHRIDVSKKDANTCKSTTYFKAPYYRSNSKNILLASFDSCTMASGWRDSVIKTHPLFSLPRWNVGSPNFYTRSTSRGSFDSTCMIYYNSYTNAYRGTLALISPVIDITPYKDTYLHFDFNFLSNRHLRGQEFGSLWVEVYDGNAWNKIMEYTHNDRPVGTQSFLKNIWDTIPQRVFINLDQYRNNALQIRFIVDDGLTRYNVIGNVFAAFDNIQVDGYLNDSEVTSNFIVFPNPSRNEIFLKFNQQPLPDINYSLLDLTGRIVRKGQLNNYRIDLKGLSAGMYFLNLDSNEKTFKTVKIIHQP